MLNCDCNDHFGMINEIDPDPEEYEKVCLDCLEGTQVDTFLLNQGIGNLADYPSKVLGMNGEYNDFNFTEPSFARNYVNAKRFMEKGIDIQEILIKGCRKRGLDVFASLRVNDVHDLWDSCVDVKPLFKKEHPEWCHPVGVHEQFGNRQPCATALDWKRKEVRDLKLAVVEELMDNHDFDGLELDFLRDNVYFHPNKGMNEAFHMTDFIRQVRKYLDELSDKRNKYIELAIRVPMFYNGAMYSGFDIPTIARDRLCDIIIGGTGGNDGMSMDTEQYEKILQGSGIRFFGCLNGFYDIIDMHNSDMATPMRKMRAVAEQIWAQGVDGISTFNLYPTLTHREALLHDIGSIDTLMGIPKTYTIEKAPSRYGKHLPLTMGETVTEFAEYTIAICEDYCKGSKDPIIRLNFFFSNGSLYDKIIYYFNDVLLENMSLIPKPTGLREFWYSFEIKKEWMAKENKIRIRLEKRHENLAKFAPLVLAGIELLVDY